VVVADDLGGSLTLKITPNLCIFVAFRTFLIGERGDFKFGIQVDHSMQACSLGLVWLGFRVWDKVGVSIRKRVGVRISTISSCRPRWCELGGINRRFVDLS